MYLSAILKRNEMTQKIADYEQQLKEINEELEDLRSYAANIADGGVTIGELMTTPTSMYNRHITFMNTSQQYSQMTAASQLQLLISQPQYQQLMMQQSGGNPQVELWYRNAAYQKFYEQAQGKFVKFEQKLLHEKEKALIQKQEALKGSLESCKAQKDTYAKEAQEGLKERFSANG
jgi:hypothetical protein